MGSADNPRKMDEKLQSENMQKNSSFLFLCYILRAIRAGRCRERRYADHILYSDILQNAPFRSQIFKIFFVSGGKGALTPLTRILRTFLLSRSSSVRRLLDAVTRQRRRRRRRHGARPPRSRLVRPARHAASPLCRRTPGKSTKRVHST